MASIEEIKQALTRVIDPELGKNVVELGMIRDIQLADGQVKILLALTIAGCPMSNQLRSQTQAAAESVPGVKNVTVELTSMTPEERQKIHSRAPSRAPQALNLNQIGRIVAVLSGKGGVGKSSVTSLLATALQRQGLTVGILDADITGPSIPRMFGITGPVPSVPFGILPIKSSSGVRVISTNLMVPEEDTAVVWRGPVVSNTIKQFWSDVLWGRLDYLLIDLPPGTSDATLTVMEALPLDGVVLVTMPQGLSSMVVRKTVHMAQGLKVPILGIVENMSYFVSPETGTRFEIFGPSQTDKVTASANAPLLGCLPIDPHLAELADTGQIEAYTHPAYDALACAFMEAIPAVAPRPAAARMAQPA
ncbi:MAG TPA: Mrp/NBP35 family ATP-binding protein [Anaerolineales bacterium]|nr:Mrp/NBP35 family ATP-binding protein [Anaerolineales bacterium]